MFPVTQTEFFHPFLGGLLSCYTKHDSISISLSFVSTRQLAFSLKYIKMFMLGDGEKFVCFDQLVVLLHP